MALLDDLKQAATPPTPAGFKPGVVFQGSTPVEVTTPPLPAMTEAGEFAQAVKDLGYPIPDGYTLELVEMQLVQHENFWTREATGDDAVTKPSSTFRYRFRVVEATICGREDLDALAEKARSEFFEVVDEPREPRSLVVALADFQTGKTDERGGTEELLARSESALARVVHKVIREKYDEVVLLDVGDSTEGFESAPNADRTNDLSQTEQIRVWRRIFWRWIDQMARVAPRVTVVAVPSNHCVDADTEILTRNGWVKVSDYTGGEIGTHNPDTGAFEWQTPYHWTARKHNGRMLKIASQRVSHVVTDGHELYGRPRSGGEMRKITAADAMNRSGWHFQETSLGGWIGEDSFPAPQKAGKSEGLPLLADPMIAARFYGWYVSEGSTYFSRDGGSHLVTISQSAAANPDHYDEVVKTWRSIGREPYCHEKSSQVGSRALAEFLSEHFGCVSGEKRLPGWLKNASEPVLREFFRAYIAGDGGKTGRDGWTSFASKSMRLLNDLQEVALKLGWRLSINPKLNSYPVAGTDYVGHAYMASLDMTPRGASVDWVSSSNGRVNAEWIDHDGMVYCPTVENGLWYARRDGKVVVTGNCRVRRGKNAVGDALDDWGIEVLAQVKDIAAANPEMYSHVEFIQPRQNTEHVILTTHGVSMAVMHGHQANNPNGLPDVLKKNARRGPGVADIAVVGHFHHLRVVNFGDEQTLLVCPSNDAGSSWFQYSGENSRAGILTFEIDENGWSGLDVIWTS